MHNHDDIPQIARNWLNAGKPVALATVVETWGSAPRPVGAQMAISSDADLAGSVSGGCVEGAVAEEALEALRQGQQKLLTYGVSDADAFAVGLACGGQIRILVDPVSTPDLAKNWRGMQATTLATIARAREKRRFIAHATLPLEAQELLLGPADRESGPFADALNLLAGQDRSGFANIEGQDWFLTLHLPPLRLAIIGGAHIAQSLAQMARLAHFDVTVIDPRESFASPARFPGTPLTHDWPDEALKAHGLDPRTAVVCLTHDPKLDDPALRAALASDAFYIGALGSMRTAAKRRERLAGSFSAAELQRIKGPVGLDIGSRSPAEIAVSILAQMIQVLRGKP